MDPKAGQSTTKGCLRHHASGFRKQTHLGVILPIGLMLDSKQNLNRKDNRSAASPAVVNLDKWKDYGVRQQSCLTIMHDARVSRRI